MSKYKHTTHEMAAFYIEEGMYRVLEKALKEKNT